MKQSILIIEDEQSMRENLAALAKTAGDVEVDCAGTEEQADQLIATKRYDVALVDLQLNGKVNGKLVGLRYAAKLADMGSGTIIVTGDGRDLISEVGMVLTKSDIVTKPFNPSVLLGHIERALLWKRRDPQNVAEADLPPELTLDPYKGTCKWHGETIRLTPTELSIVREIWLAKGQKVDLPTLKEFLKSGNKHAVTQHIANIRRKFQAVDETFDKITCHGGAYFWI
jgi:two-component system OmpR family response regulator